MKKAIKISVIIPTYNRPKLIENCLDALQKQTFEDYEIIVVDDGGTIDLSFIEEYFSNTTYIRQKNSGPALARNRGAAMAKGKYLAFLDDDCEPQPDWLEVLYKYAETNYLIGGQTKNKLVKNNYSEASQLIVSFLIDYFKNTPWWFFTSNNFMMERELFLKIGGFSKNFHTSAGEDREFCMRWLHKGYQMKYIPSAVIDHLHDLSFISFWKMHQKYGKAALSYQEAIGMMGVESIPFKPSFYIKLLTYPWKKTNISIVRKTILSVLVFFSQLAIFAGFFVEKKDTLIE